MRSCHYHFLLDTLQFANIDTRSTRHRYNTRLSGKQKEGPWKLGKTWKETKQNLIFLSPIVFAVKFQTFADSHAIQGL